MNDPGSKFSKILLTASVAFGLGACAPQSTRPVAMGPVSVPTTGSAQGVNTHNSEPMPSGMRMQGNGVAPGTSFSSDRTLVPTTGNAQGVNTHNSEPMPRGMRMQGNTPAGTPIQADPGAVPNSSTQGVNPMNSQPMPSGMVMPNATTRY